MLWLPASKLIIPSPMEVFPPLFNAEGFGTATGGLICGFSDGNAPNVSVNVTAPDGVPCPEAPTTSALTKMTLPNGYVPPASGRPFGSRPEILVVLASWLTVTGTPAEVLAANVPFPA